MIVAPMHFDRGCTRGAPHCERGLFRQVTPKRRNLTPRANNFGFVFDRKSLGHRHDPSVGLIGFKIRQSFTEADRTSEF
jgi:hypothetical protein